MAYVKTEWKDFPSEDTPITASALNNIEDCVEDLDTRLTTAEGKIDNLQNSSKVLYDNPSGTTGTVTLSETSANFSYLEIIYGGVDTVRFSVKIPNPNGKSFVTNRVLVQTDGVYHRNKNYTISGITITPGTGAAWNIKSSGVVEWEGTTVSIYIYQVVGYR